MRHTWSRTATGLAAAVTVLALAGCGSTSAPSNASHTESREPGQAGAEALARHDRLFPQVAATCAGVAATPPSAPAAAPTGDGGTWADKYAENHAYKQTVRLLADAQCRGEAHAARIADALRPAGTPAVLDEAASARRSNASATPPSWSTSAPPPAPPDSTSKSPKPSCASAAC